MQLRETPENLPKEQRFTQVYGEPFEVADGTTVLPVFKVRGNPVEQRARTRGFNAKPVGVFVFKKDEVRWEPAVDRTQLSLVGGLIGFTAVLVFGIAAIRRAPWPDVRITSASRSFLN
ncbi:hypothetical protein [Amycolatopsis nigrescens]|uniref:hypothetical protein n=1 Tax=Amycolatopsis nigrescens TaxID=381445 RepID=UPI0003653D30|nr:hypothetical protein [Amycolatopsis nigrescens]